MGHGIYPAAAASIGACAKMAHYADLHHSSILSNKKDERDIVVEEKRRTLWTLHNLDRYDWLNQVLHFLMKSDKGTWTFLWEKASSQHRLLEK